MSIKIIYKLLFRITLFLSLVSYQGYPSSYNNSTSITELIVTEDLVTETSNYFWCFTKTSVINASNTFVNFSFDCLIYTQSISFNIVYTVQTLEALRIKELDNISQLKLISPTNTDIFIITS